MLDLNIQVKRRDFTLDCALQFSARSVALLGPSGAGKSTILKAIAGLVVPSAGYINLADRSLFDAQGGVNVPVDERRLGFVFQDARLFPHMSVFKNLGYGAQRRGGASRSEIEAMAEFLGLAALLKRRPASLSGGEAQRVAVGRALLSKPDLLLLDEPLSGLDEARKADILSVFEQLKARGDVPMLFVSHDRKEVARLADEIALIEQGRCVGVGTVDEVMATTTSDVVSRLQAKLVAKDATFGLSELSVSAGRILVPQVKHQLGTHMAIEIAARDVMLANTRPEDLSALNVLPAKIVAIERKEGGGRCLVSLQVGKETLRAEITERSNQLMELAVDKEVFAIIKAVAIGQPSGLMSTVET